MLDFCQNYRAILQRGYVNVYEYQKRIEEVQAMKAMMLPSRDWNMMYREALSIFRFHTRVAN
eukprot:SAG11_NODE_2344_length_3487_cov_28.493506_3_plen_62_part_00